MDLDSIAIILSVRGKESALANLYEYKLIMYNIAQN